MWRSFGEGFNFHIVNWPKIRTLDSSRCLRVINLIVFNHDLLQKWWQFATKRDDLQQSVVEVKNGDLWIHWCSNEVIVSYGVSILKNIRVGEYSPNLIKFQAGNGTKIKLWHGIQCSNQSLKAVLLRQGGIDGGFLATLQHHQTMEYHFYSIRTRFNI